MQNKWRDLARGVEKLANSVAEIIFQISIVHELQTMEFRPSLIFSNLKKNLKFPIIYHVLSS